MDSKWKNLQQEVQELRVLINYYRKKDKDLMRVSISDQSGKYSNDNNTEEEVQKRKPYSNFLPNEICNILRDRGEPMTRNEIIQGLEDRKIENPNKKRTMSHTVAISLAKNPLFKLTSDNINADLKTYGLSDWPSAGGDE